MKLAYLKQSLAALAVLGASCWGPAQASDYPERPVKIVVPYAPGGGSDNLARLLGKELGNVFRQPMIIENRPGAGLIIGADAVAKSAPDGYTLLFAGSESFLLTPLLMKKVPYDTMKDLTGVSLVASVPLYLAVRTASNIDSLDALIAHIRAHPGKLNYGSAGAGTIHHLAMETFKAALGLNIVHVPYKGSGASAQGFLGGDTTVLVASLPSIVSHVKAGTVKLLATTALSRTAQAPDVPALSELVAGFDYPSELGMLAPSGTPSAVIGKLSGEIAKVIKQPDVARALNDSIGGHPIGSTPDAYNRRLADSLARLAKAVRIAGLQPE